MATGIVGGIPDPGRLDAELPVGGEARGAVGGERVGELLGIVGEFRLEPDPGRAPFVEAWVAYAAVAR